MHSSLTRATLHVTDPLDHCIQERSKFARDILSTTEIDDWIQNHAPSVDHPQGEMPPPAPMHMPASYQNVPVYSNDPATNLSDSVLYGNANPIWTLTNAMQAYSTKTPGSEIVLTNALAAFDVHLQAITRLVADLHRR